MLRKIWFVLVIVNFMIASMFAEGSGGFSGAFLRVGLGARALAMGNAQVATANSPYGTFYNPAALPNLEKRNFAASYSALSLDRKFNYLGFALPLGPFGGAALGWINSGVGNLRAYNSIGQDVGELNHGFNAIYLSFGIKMIALIQADKQLMNLPPDLINLGVSVKFMREDLDDNEDFDYKGSGFGVDIGVQVKLHPALTVGYQVKDLNASLSSNTSNIFERGSDLDNKFPISQRIGLFYHTPLKWLAAAYDFEWNDAGENKHHLGTELSARGVFGRIGYDDERFTFGGGIDFRAFKNVHMTLDYAFLDDLANEGAGHVFSWQFRF